MNAVALLCCEHSVAMDYFISNPCVFHHASRKICEHLNLSEKKSMSLVSRQWFESTCSSIVDQCVFRAKDWRNVKKTIRHYRKYRIESEDVGRILRALHSSILEKKTMRPRKNFDIEKIILENCILSAEGIRSLFNFWSLVCLEIVHCKMGDGSGMIEVPPMNLEKLKVYNSIPIFIENLINSSSKQMLKSLHLSTAQGSLLSRLEIPHLEKITIWETDNFHDLDTFLRRHSFLTYCNFEGLQLPDFIFTTLSRCRRKLKTLKINRYSELSDYSLTVIRDMPSLEHLSLSRISLSADVLTKIGSPNLKTLDFCNMRTSLNFQNFQMLFKNMPNLTDLKLAYCKQNITNEVLTLIANSFLNLETLDVSGNDYLCIELDSKPKNFQNLRRLNLDNSKISDAFLTTIQAPKIHELDIYLDGVSCESIEKFIENSPFIKNLFLRNCDNLNDKTISNILRSLKYLEYLELNQGNNLTIDSVCSVLLGTFITKANLTVNTTVEDLNMICANHDLILEHHGIISEISNGCRRITVYKV